MQTLIHKTFKLTKPIKDLERLCIMLNCFIPFQILKTAKVNQEHLSSKLIEQIKRVNPDKFLKVPEQRTLPHHINIPERQHIQWFIASEQLEIDVHVTFIPDNNCGIIKVNSLGDKIKTERFTIEGEFETLSGGKLIIEIDNTSGRRGRVIWFRVKQATLSKSHIFEGIFNKIYSSTFHGNDRAPTENDLATILEKVFRFIDHLLDGQIKLKEMVDLKVIFCNKNIDVRDEVKKLISYQSMIHKVDDRDEEKAIERVCEWLQTYQYYSYINIIVSCVQKFNIISNENDETIKSIVELSDENCSLERITETYRNLKQKFRKLTNQHLQLIKTASEYPNVIQMMDKAQLYTTHGRRRFQELRDNLTTQFQLQERNNVILNAWIIVYEFCEPFTTKANSLEDFVESIARLPYLDDSPVTHMQSK